jgi:hypothetical protein
VEGLLPGAVHAWSERFARGAFAWFRRRAAGAAGRAEARLADDWRVVELLPPLAMRLPPALAAEAADGWPAELPPPWARAVERFLALLTFRRTLDAAFTE